MKKNKKMQKFEIKDNRIIFNNYLLDISNKDFERKTNHYRHFIRIFGISHILKECYLEIKNNVPKKQVLKFLTSELATPKSSIDCWIHGFNPIPIFKAYLFLKIWKKICKKTDKEFKKKWGELFTNTESYHICGGAKDCKVTLPKELTEDLTYIMGFILADGYIKSDDKLLSRKKYPEYTISMYSGSKQFLQGLKKVFLNLFNVKCNLYYAEDKKGSWYTLRCTSKPVHRFFCDVLGFKSGSKTGYIDAPEIISESPKKFQKAFISGFFDGDGGVGISTKNPWLELVQVSYNQKPTPIILWIQEKLNEFGINLALSNASQKNLWRLRTGSKKEILKFYDAISSRYPSKINIYESIRGFSYGTKV